MKCFDIRYLTGFLLIIFSCSPSEKNENYFDMEFEELAKRYVPLDTIPLSDSINYFNYDVNIDRIKENKITAAQFPNFSVFMLDSIGQVKSKITQAGDGLGMLGNANFALSAVDEMGNIYVLTVGNSYRLFIFGEDYNFIKVFNLFKIIDEATVYVVNNSFKIDEKSNNKISIFISVGSTVYPRNSVEFYENAFSVVEFTIDLERLEIVDHAKHLPYRDVPEVKEALSGEKVWWSINNPVFEIKDEMFYVAYPFSNSVAVYDSVFNFVENINFLKLKNISSKRYFKAMGKTIEDRYDRVIMSQRLSSENLKINRIDIQDNYLLIQFPEILKENGYYLPEKNEIGTVREAPAQHLHAIIKNLDTGEEKFITLPSDFYHIHIIDWNTFYGYHKRTDKEYTALIKFRYD